MTNYRDYVPRSDAFTDRVVLVTGATSGIGRAVAKDLARHGTTVIAHGRNAKALEDLYQELRELGPEPTVAQIDFERAQGEAYQELTAQIETRYGRLDGLLHNAGILGDKSPVEYYDIALWQRVMHVNFNSAFILTRCMLPLLKQSDDASLLFTTSGVGRRGRAYWGAYCTSKFATEGLFEILADELESTNVRVNCINPGATRTKMRSRAYPAEDPATLLTPEALTASYLYLLGREAKGVTGQRIDCQG